MKSKSEYNFSVGLFIAYFIILTWIILFKLSLDFSQLGHLRNINLIPFCGSTIVNNRIEVKEIVYNILIFVPFGIYLNMLKSEWTFINKVATCFLISLVFEVLQFIFAIGASDITDIIGNTLGGIIGMGVFCVITKILKNKAIKVINILALISTLAVVTLGALLFIYNM